MKVAIISLGSYERSKTGNWIQAIKTADALKMRGLLVDHLFIHLDGKVTTAEQRPAGTWQEVCEQYDILHAIPPIPRSYLRKWGLPRKPKLVASTVFWRSPTYTKVVQRESGKFDLKAIAQDVAARLGVQMILAYADYALLLPNSQDEIAQFRKYCRHKASALFRAVPNGIDPVPE